jgi:hemerythrin
MPYSPSYLKVFAPYMRKRCKRMEKVEVSTGVSLLNIPECGLSILCGCPPDVVKLLMKRGIINRRPWPEGLWETGPNAILLSDLSIQGGKFSNLAEFPILQMFYRQGMIVPGHPGNTGAKPVVMGLSSQLSAVCEYLFRGTYGLANLEEIIQSGVPADMAAEIIRLKLSFAFNQIRKSEDILELHPLDSGEREIREGLSARRTGVNAYSFTVGGQTVEVNLNLAETERYVSPIQLEYHKVQRDYFSVVHLGEGDGWDPQRPCMSSIVCFQGRIYLIDTGPNILDSLTALGISVNEIEGIFHTHAHDDHFAGLTSLVRTDHKIKYYATPMVRASVMKKLAALMSLPEKRFMRSFEVHDLKQDEWNNIAGLEVMPVYSPHPVEDTVLFFRAMWEDGYKTYAHLADIAALSTLERMLMKADDRTEVSETLYRQFTSRILAPADIKKIDIGGGMIHGMARDFADDTSKKIVLAHLGRDLTPTEKEIGSNASFGLEDVLIPSRHDYFRDQARTYLSMYFPDAASSDIGMLINCPIQTLNMGFIIQKRDTPSESVYLIITGVVEMVQADTGEVTMLSAGTLIGESNAFGDAIPKKTYRARSYINVLIIPPPLYLAFVKRNAALEDARRNCATAFFLQTTPLFGEMVSSPVLHSIAVCLLPRQAKKYEKVENIEDSSLFIVRKGSFDVFIDDVPVDRIGVGDFFGEECVFFSGSSMMSAIALEDSECFRLRADLLRDVPIVEWKMLEVYERRLTAYGEQIS